MLVAQHPQAAEAGDQALAPQEDRVAEAARPPLGQLFVGLVDRLQRSPLVVDVQAEGVVPVGEAQAVPPSQLEGNAGALEALHALVPTRNALDAAVPAHELGLGQAPFDGPQADLEHVALLPQLEPQPPAGLVHAHLALEHAVRHLELGVHALAVRLHPPGVQFLAEVQETPVAGPLDVPGVEHPLVSLASPGTVGAGALEVRLPGVPALVQEQHGLGSRGVGGEQPAVDLQVARLNEFSARAGGGQIVLERQVEVGLRLGHTPLRKDEIGLRMGDRCMAEADEKDQDRNEMPWRHAPPLQSGNGLQTIRADRACQAAREESFTPIARSAPCPRRRGRNDGRSRAPAHG